MNKSRILQIAITIFLLIWGVGVTTGAGFVLSLWTVRTCRVFTWPKAEGVVRASSVVTWQNRRSSELYFNVLSVEYAVDGVTNCTSRLYPYGNEWSSTRFMHEARKNAFPVGAVVAVRYNSVNPADACVGYVGIGEVLWGMIPLVLLPVGLVILVVAVPRVWRKKC